MIVVILRNNNLWIIMIWIPTAKKFSKSAIEDMGSLLAFWRKPLSIHTRNIPAKPWKMPRAIIRHFSYFWLSTTTPKWHMRNLELKEQERPLKMECTRIRCRYLPQSCWDLIAFTLLTQRRLWTTPIINALRIIHLCLILVKQLWTFPRSL